MMRFLLSGNSIENRCAKQYAGPELMWEHIMKQVKWARDSKNIFPKTSEQTLKDVKEHLFFFKISEKNILELLGGE